MAQVTNTFSSFDTIGIRESLANIIYDLAPAETPFMSNISSESVSNTFFEWQTDVLMQMSLLLATVIENSVNCWKLPTGQSAAKLGRNAENVQRLGYGVQTGQ